MSDFYSTIIIKKAKTTDAKRIAEKVIQHLVQRRIIKVTQKENVFNEQTHNCGFEPDTHFNQAVSADDDHTLTLRTNGVSVKTGRQYFWTTNTEALLCPNCENDIFGEDAESDAMENWIAGNKNHKITCEACGKKKSIVDYIFEPHDSGALGELGFEFWNWGAFKADFIAEIETLIGIKVSVIYGKL